MDKHYPYKPPGEKPTTGETPEPGTYISPRLREKLMEAGGDEELETKRSSPVLPLVMVAALIAVGGGVFFVIKKGPATKQQTAATNEPAPAAVDSAALADSLARASADTSAATPPSGTAAATPPGASAASAGAKAATASAAKPPTQASATAKTPPASTPKASASGTGASAGATAGGASAGATASTTRYGIVVGTFLSEDGAKAAQAKLSVDLPAQVLPATEGGATVYQVVLGSFNSRASAEGKAGELASQGVVTEARVIRLPGS